MITIYLDKTVMGVCAGPKTNNLPQLSKDGDLLDINIF